MAVTRISDVVVPVEFTDYVVQNTMQKSALVQSGVAVKNPLISSHLARGSESFTIPFWNDLSDDEANIVTDNPDEHSTPLNIGAGKQTVRKSYLHQSWSAMNLASELAGSDALTRIKNRASDYWARQLQRRLIASLKGVMADNVANDNSDMVWQTVVSGNTGMAQGVIDAASTLGDAMGDVKSIAMHSAIYANLLKDDLIEYIRASDGSLVMTTFRGLAVVVDDALVPDDDGIYTNILFGQGAIGYGFSPPVVADGTEIENLPSAGNGGGQQILHSRINAAMHPLGFTWVESSVASESPSLSELANPVNWNRVIERKAVPLAFLLTSGANPGS